MPSPELVRSRPSARVLLFVAGVVVLTVAGLVVITLDRTPWLTAVGGVMFGVAGVATVGAMFYAVGRSEDRDRERRPHG